MSRPSPAHLAVPLTHIHARARIRLQGPQHEPGCSGVGRYARDYARQGVYCGTSLFITLPFTFISTSCSCFEIVLRLHIVSRSYCVVIDRRGNNTSLSNVSSLSCDRALLICVLVVSLLLHIVFVCVHTWVEYLTHRVKTKRRPVVYAWSCYVNPIYFSIICSK
jgi:hypothetical protein